MTTAELLGRQMDEAYAFMLGAVDGLTEEEFAWEPVEGCWTVRQGPDGRWAADYPEPPHPVPGPFTTIGWRLVHVAEAKLMYHDYAFGAASLVWPDIDSTHTATDAIASLEAWQALLDDDLASIDDMDLETPRLTNWGEQWPTWRIFWTMIEHDIHHGAEIGALRDLLRVTGGTVPSRAT
jgi:uncharacterized damage-inducible protein DinB